MTRKLPKKIQDQIRYEYPGDRYVKRAKYSNRSCVCWMKHTHQSILESDLCNLKKLEGKPFSIQYKIEIKVNGKHICNHYVDFADHKTWKDAQAKINPIRFIESKGFEQEIWKLKRKLVEAIYPEIPYIVKYERPKFYRGKIS